MSKLDNDFKNEFNNLEFDSDKIQKQIMIKYNNHKKTKKITVSIISLLMLTLVGFGIVYAQEIGEVINDIFIRKTIKQDKEGNSQEYKDIITKNNINIDLDYQFKDVQIEYDSYNGPTSENDTDFQILTYDELKNLFKVNIVKSKLIKRNAVFTKSSRKTNGEQFIWFKMPNILQDYSYRLPKKSIGTFNDNVTYVTLEMYVNLNSTEEHTYASFIEDEFATPYEEIRIDNLNTKAIYFKERKHRSVLFTYDGITYKYRIMDYFSDDDTFDKKVKEFINSLYV